MPNFMTTMGRNSLTDAEWASLTGWITSSLLLGAFIAAPFAAPLSDTFGRKICINLSSVIICIGAIIEATATNFGEMIAGRVLVGLGIGISSATVPVYLAELSPRSIRGSISSLFEVTIAFGILLAFVVTLAMNYFYPLNPTNWRWILAIQAALALSLSLLMIPLPESSRWLMSVDKREEARDSLLLTRILIVVGSRKNEDGENCDITSIDLEYNEISKEIDDNRADKPAWYDYSKLLAPKMQLRTSISIIIKFLQQLTGINSIFYYSSIIFSSLGIQADTTTAITGLVNLAATLIAVRYIETLGRRPLLITGSILMTVCLFIVGNPIKNCISLILHYFYFCLCFYLHFYILISHYHHN